MLNSSSWKSRRTWFTGWWRKRKAKKILIYLPLKTSAIFIDQTLFSFSILVIDGLAETPLCILYIVLVEDSSFNKKIQEEMFNRKLKYPINTYFCCFALVFTKYNTLLSLLMAISTFEHCLHICIQMLLILKLGLGLGMYK